MDMKFAKIGGLLVLIVTVFVLAFALLNKKEGNNNVPFDSFAQCIASKGLVMYGAYWCPHCQNEKKAFGDSFKFISYVECGDNPKLCSEKGVSVLPTWIFPDGRKLEGEQGISGLSSATGCLVEKAENISE
jgi:hypothetical protein